MFASPVIQETQSRNPGLESFHCESWNPVCLGTMGTQLRKAIELLGTILFVIFNPFMPTIAFNICCPRDCVSRHNGGTAGAPLKPLRDDSALRALSSLRGLEGAPAVPPLCGETQSLGQQILNATVGINGLMRSRGRFPTRKSYFSCVFLLFLLL